MDRILSIFYFLFALCLFVFLSQIFISSFPLRISSPLCYSVVQGVLSSPFISSPVVQGGVAEIDWSLSTRLERRRIMEKTTKSLKLASVRLLSTHRHHHHHHHHHHHRGAHPHHHLRFWRTLHHH